MNQGTFSDYHVAGDLSSTFAGPGFITGRGSGDYAIGDDGRTWCGVYFSQGWSGIEYPRIGSRLSKN